MSTQLNLNELRQRLIQKNNEMRWFGSLNGIVITEIGDGYCRAYADITEDSFGPFGQVHSGVLCTLMDDLAAMAAAGTGRGSVTVNGKNDYFTPVTRPCRLEGISQLEGETGLTCTYHTAVYQDNVLVASGTYTFYRMEDLTHR
ncbi:MAG: PaaI family thioesterase [Oscillospiraceae bacterium]|nr:PaaI family thioesterase [Oscillospiraceae bacterium]